MSLFHDFAREFGGTLIGFGQVFLGSAIVVAIAYGLKARLLGNKPKTRARRSQQRKARQSGAAPGAKRSAATPRGSADPVQLAPATSNELTSNTAPNASMLDVHWERAIEPLRISIARTERANELHKRALVRLDSADYALQRLIDELADVIPRIQEAVPTAVAEPAGNVPEHAPADKLAA